MAMTTGGFGRMESLDQLRQGVDTLFKALESASTTGGGGMTMTLPQTGRGVSPTFCMPLDISEEDNDYEVFVDVPGCQKENISLKVDEPKSAITITAERRPGAIEESEHMHKLLMRERGGGRIQRTVTLPTDADLESAEAELHEGVLCLKVPKNESRGKRKMMIK